MTKFTIPRADYRALPFSLAQNGVALDMAGYTFVFTLKKHIAEPDGNFIIFEKIIVIPTGAEIKSALLEIESTDSDHAPGSYWLECSSYTDPAKPITGNPIQFTITERERKTMPVVEETP